MITTNNGSRKHILVLSIGYASFLTLWTGFDLGLLDLDLRLFDSLFLLWDLDRCIFYPLLLLFDESGEMSLDRFKDLLDPLLPLLNGISLLPVLFSFPIGRTGDGLEDLENFSVMMNSVKCPSVDSRIYWVLCCHCWIFTTRTLLFSYWADRRWTWRSREIFHW